ncbi:MAG: SRPBCC family protein [Flavobacteriales bacterium]|nr:SRPBCC family protein [Flavobacteriales bacterium]
MGVHLLEREQVLEVDIAEAWAFFSSPRNLGLITPSYMRFCIRAPFDDRPAHSGQLITYTVQPLMGIPLTWITRIEEVVPGQQFVDTQRKGPFKRWRHLHRFEAVTGGTLMHDHVAYELPLGAIGELAHKLAVRARIEGIFAYRERVLPGLVQRIKTKGLPN